MAIRNIKPIAELNRCCADNDFFVRKLFQRGEIATQYILIGDRRQGIGIDTEINLKWLFLPIEIAAQQRAYRR